MTKNKIALLVLFMVSQGISAHFGAGWSLGWQKPFGFGPEIAIYSSGNELQAGAGFSVTGLRYGALYNAYLEDEGNSFILGAAFIGTIGDEVTVSVTDNSGTYTGIYEIPSAYIFIPRIGYGFGTKKIPNFKVFLGYGLDIFYNPVVQKSGDSNEIMDLVADVFHPKGLELSFQYMYYFDNENK